MGKRQTYNFIRFGALSQMNQVRYGIDTFHAPPCKKGIYAFPQGIVDRFLLGATNDPRNPSHKSYWLRDENGIRINDKGFWDDNWNSKRNNFGINKKYLPLIKKNKIKLKDIFTSSDYKEGETPIWYICVYKKPRKFDYDGDIWSHLGEHLKPEHIIKESGTWAKTIMEDYLTALQKEKHSLKKYKIQVFGMGYKDTNPFKNMCTDHLEVFIEKIN